MAQFLRNISILILNMKATSKKLKQQSLLLLFSLFLTSSLPRSLTQFLSLKIFLSFYHNSLSLSPLSFSLSLSPPLSFTRNLSLSFSFIAMLRSHPSSFGHMAQRKKAFCGVARLRGVVAIVCAFRIDSINVVNSIVQP